jgi:hypothetical protein
LAEALDRMVAVTESSLNAEPDCIKVVDSFRALVTGGSAAHRGAAPRASLPMPCDNAERVVSGARAIAPFLGKRTRGAAVGPSGGCARVNAAFAAWAVPPRQTLQPPANGIVWP